MHFSLLYDFSFKSKVKFSEKTKESLFRIDDFHYSFKPSSNKIQRQSGQKMQRLETSQVSEQNKYLEKIKNILENNKKKSSLAKKLNLTGAVGLKLVINQKGEIINTLISKRSGHEVLNEKALESVRNIELFPAPPASFGASFIVDFNFVFE